MATISLGIPLLVKKDLELADDPIKTRYYHINTTSMIASCVINCLTCFVSAQVSKLQNTELIQQG